MKHLLNTLLIVIMACAANNALADGHFLLKRCQTAVDFMPHIEQAHSQASQGKHNNNAQEERRNNSRATEMAYCHALLRGVIDTNRFYEFKTPENAFFCMQERTISNRNAAQLVVYYLERNPQELHKGEARLAIQALRQHYPCPDKHP